MHLRSRCKRQVLPGVWDKEAGAGTGRCVEVQLRYSGDGEVLSGMRRTEAGGGRMDLCLRNGQ